MSKLKKLTLIGVLMGLLVLALSHFSVNSAPSPARVRLITDPPISQIRPFEAQTSRNQLPTTLTIQAFDTAGNPLRDSRTRLQIQTRPRNIWFTTDYPIVEGKVLLDLIANAPTGELTLQQLLPIRGVYQLLVEVAPLVTGSFEPFQQTLALPVTENAFKYQYLAVLSGLLLSAGLVGGLVIGGNPEIRAGEIAPQRVRLLLSGAAAVAIVTILGVNIMAELAEAHHHSMPSMGSEMAPTHPPLQIAQGLKLELKGNPNALVGEPLDQAVQVLDASTDQPVTDVTLDLRVTQLESKTVTFAYQGSPDPKGQLVWQQLYFDGSPHQLDVTVSPLSGSDRSFSPFQVSQEVDVEAVAAPLSVRLISLAYLMVIVAVGMGVGFWIRRRTSIATELAPVNQPT